MFKRKKKQQPLKCELHSRRLGTVRFIGEDGKIVSEIRYDPLKELVNGSTVECGCPMGTRQIECAEHDGYVFWRHILSHVVHSGDTLTLLFDFRTEDFF